MSKATKGAANPDAEVKNMPFEEALQKLEAVVEAMESDELPLEKLLERYEEGMRLTALCQAKLAEAEVKIQKLEKDAAGRLGLTPVDLSDDTQ
ncbi:MAG: exodeoxyribonuclease VII small subunit [Verrucomicrobiota bacterium]